MPGLGRCSGEGKGYPLQYSDLENSMDCIVHGVTERQTWLSDFHFSDHKGPVGSDWAPGHQLCRNEFPIKTESSETYKVFIRKKKEYMWIDRLRENHTRGNFNHLYGAFLPRFPWPVIFALLASESILGLFQDLPICVHASQPRWVPAKRSMSRLISPTMGWCPLPFWHSRNLSAPV